MAGESMDTKHENVDSLRDMSLKEEGASGDIDMDTIPVANDPRRRPAPRGQDTSGNATPMDFKGSLRSPVKSNGATASPALKNEDEEVVGGDVELKFEAGRPKLARTKSHKVEKRPPPLFHDYEDRTEEAKDTFTVLPECTYANKYLGTTEHALECDCAEEWDSSTQTNHACGEDSDCINRATKMECLGDCGCGTACQNQRFLRKQYADVSVIKTEKKGHGLRANTDLKAGDFIFEYIGEVIGENVFRRRMQQYDEEGIKHFYFMSLTKGEFVDATKKGNLGRFCNHSCNPNCYVDKWVVGDKLRMGIFAERKIQAGEELVFNYNVDRYGADPQPCYCGEPNCTGYIGGKTQTERATKLSNAIIEALGIDDADAWDTAVAKKPRKKKQGEDDEEYVNNVEPRGLDEEGVNKVMSSLMQCKEKWIAVKLLTRIQRADDEKVRNRVVRFHGYRILKTALSNFIDDVNVCLQVLDVLDKMPRLTRNKIQDSKIEETVAQLKDNPDERVASRAITMLEAWSKLEVAYRIPRMKRDPNAKPERRETERRRSRSRSRERTKSPERIQAPTGPRSNVPARGGYFGGRPRGLGFRPPPPPPGGLPPGWFEAAAANGSIYYYNNAGTTTWQRPVMPATGAPPPPPPKAVADHQALQDLIQGIVKDQQEAKRLVTSQNATPQETPKKKEKERKEDKYRGMPEEKRKKRYEATISEHVVHVAGKYKHKLGKEVVKKLGKELTKKVVEGDFKRGRVDDPTKISDKAIRGLKKHAQEYFEKAVKKHAEAERRRAEKKAANKDDGSHTPLGTPPAAAASPGAKEDGDVNLSDDEAEDGTPGAPDLKRRRDEEANGFDDEDESGMKRLRTETPTIAPPPPPPPPPPPAEAMEIETDVTTPNGDFSASHVQSGQDGFRFKGIAGSGSSRPGSAQRNADFKDAYQTATPPTTGSPDVDGSEKAPGLDTYAGMNPERMRQLGLLESASN
ncbi:histone-lysine N-methyltransferase [Teratosphaeria destructans]|uniref:Histone-lysine N-methyltransferase, H3 lysine-36 specific n=1 Tax=Teratosphaeria destructans TaxID=418781 RepID=A0A9W7SZK3_9PEZI|nr:histone-lysine N-methyltransferase [Teratosphaeria destructans]